MDEEKEEEKGMPIEGDGVVGGGGDTYKMGEGKSLGYTYSLGIHEAGIE